MVNFSSTNPYAANADMAGNTTTYFPYGTGKSLQPNFYGGQSMKDTQAYKDWQKQLTAAGYDQKARPYQFDQSAFVNPFYSQNQTQIQSGLQGAQGQAGATQGNQNALVDYLMKQSQGQTPTVGQLQLQQGLGQNIAGQMAAAATGRGNPALARRNMAQNIGTLGQNTAMQSAQTGIGEAEQARQDLGNVLGQQQSQQNQMIQYYMSQGLSQDQAQWQAQMDLQNQMAQQHSQAQQTLSQRYSAEKGATGKPGTGMQGAMGGIGAAMGALSFLGL